MGEISVSSEAAMLNSLPAAGLVKLFINTDKSNILYYVDSNGNFSVYNANDTSALEGCCSCDIAKMWMKAVACALDSGILTADQYGTIMNQGIAVTSTESVNPETGAKTCTVEIGPKQSASLTPLSIQANPVEIEGLGVGNSENIYWYVFPISASQTVTFQSSNNGVATVNSAGVVLGIAPGVCVVTITSVVNPSVSKTVNVTVVP